MDEYRMPTSPCLNCGKKVDGATPVMGGRAPQSGDISICFYCHHVAAYGEDLQLRELNDEDVEAIAGEPELVFAIEMLGQFKKHEAGKKR